MSAKENPPDLAGGSVAIGDGFLCGNCRFLDGKQDERKRKPSPGKRLGATAGKGL